MEQWYIDNLVCPISKSSLKFESGMLVSSVGKKYPVVDGVPIMLVDDIDQTMPLINASLERSKKNSSIIDERASHLYLESLGVSEDEKKGIISLDASGESKIDPVVSYIMAATSGYAYKKLLGKSDTYPIPELRLNDGFGKCFLDVGCNWGRWSIAAARKGYSVVGIDPSLGAIMAARRVAEKLGLPNRYIVGDSRFLPFKGDMFDQAFSYSVFQHLSPDNVKLSLLEINRVLSMQGKSLIQMPNYLGIRNFQHQFKRRFRKARGFEVRYWKISELESVFSKRIGESKITVDCYFGLGLQKNDMKYMSCGMRFVISLSEFLRKISKSFTGLKYVADSLYIESVKG